MSFFYLHIFGGCLINVFVPTFCIWYIRHSNMVSWFALRFFSTLLLLKYIFPHPYLCLFYLSTASRNVCYIFLCLFGSKLLLQSFPELRVYKMAFQPEENRCIVIYFQTVGLFSLTRRTKCASTETIKTTINCTVRHEGIPFMHLHMIRLYILSKVYIIDYIFF